MRLVNSRNLLIIIIVAALLATGLSSTAHASGTQKQVVVLNFQEAVDPGSAAFFKSDLLGLTPSTVGAVVINMNTPGGYITEMEQMISYINQTEAKGIPVYTYVDPSGLASSAGSYIAMASDYIFMGPGSSIGPSAPVVLGGSSSETTTMIQLMTSLAVAHGKNVSAALSMIVSDATYTSTQALSLNLIDGQANNLSAFLQLEGLASSQNAPNVVIMNPNAYDNFLTFLSNSFVDGILITIGVLAILMDIYHGSIILSVVGLIMIGLGLIGAEIIGAPFIGFIFLIVGAALILFEFKTGHGFMMISGIVVGVVGAFLLTPSYITYSPSASSSSPFSEANLFVAAGVIIVAFMVAYYLQYIIRSLGKKKYTGLEGMIGQQVEVKEELVPEGWVSYEGQRWKARLVSGNKAAVGEKVIVRSNEGLTLLVEKKEDTN